MLDVFEMPIDYIPDGRGNGKPVYANAANRVQVRFVRKYEDDVEESLKQNKRVSKEVILMLKKVKGDTNVVPSFPTEHDKKVAYRAEWEAFLAGKGDLAMKLDNLPGLGPKSLSELRYIGVTTIPELANLDESLLADVTDGARCQAIAKVWISSIDKDAKQVDALVELSELKASYAELQKENEDLKAAMSAKTPAKPKTKRKRRTKAEMEAAKKAKEV